MLRPPNQANVAMHHTALAPTLTTETLRCIIHTSSGTCHKHIHIASSSSSFLSFLSLFLSILTPRTTTARPYPPLQVLTGASAATSAACCSACAAYNAKAGNNSCGIGVWHNLSPPSCVLKYSANMPVPGKLVIGYIPPPQPLTFRYAREQPTPVFSTAALLLPLPCVARWFS